MLAPNVTLTKGTNTNGPSAQAFIRGIGQSDGHPGLEPGVGIYVDDVYHGLLLGSDLDVTEYQTLASLGIPMQVIGYNAKLLRDQAGNNMYYNTNSITLAGGESLDVILDACKVRDPTSGNCTTPYAAGDVYYLYTPNLDHLSNDAENFGGLMTEVHII